MANLRISEEQLQELIYEYQKTKDKKVAVSPSCRFLPENSDSLRREKKAQEIEQ